ncbi:hypothetical protein DXG01_003638 [Tephrocybe rancida]|nr:hypothetical protein DXG01_003638 [Tephrocybe rancida]
MLPQTRQRLKQALWWTRIKLVYSRITLTRFTTLYFFFALFNCIILVVLQGVAYADNSKAVHIIEGLLSESSVIFTQGLPVFNQGLLQICDEVPGQPGANCTTVASSINATKNGYSLVRRDGHPKIYSRVFIKTSFAKDEDEDEDEEDDGEHNQDKPKPITSSDNIPPATSSGVGYAPSNAGSEFAISTVPCAQAMTWLDDVLQDEKREDIVTLFFNIWLLSLAIVTILNESLPHLGASLVGHTLGTAWAAFRIGSHERLQHRYEDIIVHNTCEFDFLESWWDSRRAHTVPILVFNVVALVAMALLSWKLFKIVLVFSASLQLTAFFSLASTSIWIDHICFKTIMNKASHTQLYLAAFVVTLLVRFEYETFMRLDLWAFFIQLLLPWLGLGWVSVRKEGRRRFLAFSVISIFLVAVSSLMFFSDLYRFIFVTWPFFATLTVTAFILIVTTALLGVWCRLNFGRGLSHYLQASDALEGVDFTPVSFSMDGEKDDTYGATFNESPRYLDEKFTLDTNTIHVQQPQAAYKSATKGRRGQSVYSEKNGTPVKLSSTPSLFKERNRAVTKARSSARRTKAFDGDHLNLGRDGYSQPQMPVRSATATTTRSTRSRDLTSSPRSSIASSTPSSSGPATPPAVAARTGLPPNPKLRLSSA